MQYLHTTLYVTDLEASLSFLEDWTGLKVLRRFTVGDSSFAFLSGGERETAVELIQGAGHSDVRYAGLSLGFAVADLDGERARAEAAGLNPSPIREPHPGVRFCFLTGPDGLTVQLMQKG